MSLAESELLKTAWTQAWQVTVLIMAIAMVIRVLARNRPPLAAALWMVVFLKCVTPPWWSSPSGAFCWMQPRQITPAQTSQGDLAVAVLPSTVVAAPTPTDAGLLSAEGDRRTRRVEMDILCPVAWLAAIWGTGVVVIFAAIAVRWRGVARLINRADAELTAPYSAILASLAHRLGIRKPVRLVVTDSQVGPAVVGLMRPTVLLPTAVTDGRSAEEVELILAHELTHVRRGDLWLAVLRCLSLALWWFHPLVWWAGRRASRETERCCDDAVLAELHCSPARYARCLLDILEIKHQLSTVPAFPGVRAIEVNQGRLERIMRIGNKGYRQTPWWCWGVAILAAAAVLPGAAIRTSADDGSNDVNLPPAAEPRHEMSVLPKPPIAIGAGVAANIRKPSEYTMVYAGTIAIEVRFVSLNEGALKEALPDSTVSPPDVPENGLADRFDVQPAQLDHPLGSHEGTHVTRAQWVVEKTCPLRIRVLEKDQCEKWFASCQDDRQTSVLQAPRVMVFSGQMACISDTSQAPFVVGLKSDKGEAPQPQIRVVSEGTTLQLRPTARRSGMIHLDFTATFSKIQKVETVSFQQTAAGGKRIQIPEVATVRMEGGAELKSGQWLLLSGPSAENHPDSGEAAPSPWRDWLLGGGKHSGRHQSQELVLMLRVDKVPLPNVATSHVVPPAKQK